MKNASLRILKKEQRKEIDQASNILLFKIFAFSALVLYVASYVAPVLFRVVY